MANVKDQHFTIGDLLEYYETKLSADRVRGLLYATMNIAPSAKHHLLESFVQGNPCSREELGSVEINLANILGVAGLHAKSPNARALTGPVQRQVTPSTADDDSESNSYPQGAPGDGGSHYVKGGSSVLDLQPPRICEKLRSRPDDNQKLKSRSGHPIDRWQHILLFQKRTGHPEGRLAFLDYGADMNLMSAEVARDLGLFVCTASEPKAVSMLFTTFVLRKIAKDVSWRAARGKRTKKANFWIPEEIMECDVLFGKPFIDDDDLNDFCDEPTDVVLVLVAKRKKEADVKSAKIAKEEADRKAEELAAKQKAAKELAARQRAAKENAVQRAH